MKIIILFISMVLISGCSEYASAKKGFEYNTITTEDLSNSKIKSRLMDLMEIRSWILKKYSTSRMIGLGFPDEKFGDLLRDQEQAIYRYHRLSECGVYIN